MASLRGLESKKTRYAIEIEVEVGLLLTEIYGRKLTDTFVVIKPSKIVMFFINTSVRVNS